MFFSSCGVDLLSDHLLNPPPLGLLGPARFCLPSSPSRLPNNHRSPIRAGDTAQSIPKPSSRTRCGECPSTPPCERSSVRWPASQRNVVQVLTAITPTNPITLLYLHRSSRAALQVDFLLLPQCIPLDSHAIFAAWLVPQASRLPPASSRRTQTPAGLSSTPPRLASGWGCSHRHVLHPVS